MKYKKLTNLILISLFLSSLQAQEAISASGGDANGNGGSISYTIGQLVYTSHTGTNSSVSQGIQQSYMISTLGIEDANKIKLNCFVFPNPTKRYLILKVENTNLSNLQYQLFNLSGKLIDKGKLTNNETKIMMGNLVSATYFLKILDNQEVYKVFKLVKN